VSLIESRSLSVSINFREGELLSNEQDETKKMITRNLTI